ncbi:MAG: hypothetical protein GY804_09200 [Alphaproteobacteria bacterium]|nr:hypothetical protein [Alphaproteobacteria bacterium]
MEGHLLRQTAPEASEVVSVMKKNLGGHEVIVMFVSPVNHLPQVLRPLQYEFTDQLVSTIYNRIEDGMSIAPLAHEDEEYITGAIGPSWKGSVLGTSVLNDLYTFTMIMDTPHGYGNNPNEGLRHIYTGYCYDEPGHNGYENPNCLLIVTHVTILSVGIAHGPHGSDHRMTIVKDEDVVPQLVQQSIDEDMCLLTPADLHNSACIQSNGSMVVFESDQNTALQHYTQESSVGIDTFVGCPGLHLKEVLRAIDESYSEATLCNGNSLSTNGFTSSAIDDFRSNLGCNLPAAKTSKSVDFILGIDYSVPIKLGDFLAKNPHTKVVTTERDSDIGLDVRPQDELSPHNIYSSMIVSTVKAAAGMTGICSIGFVFQSWINTVDVTFKKDLGQWELGLPGFDTNLTDRQQMSAITKFKHILMNNMFKTLKTQRGDFWVSVQYSSIGEIIVDLQFTAEPRNQGLYVTSAHMGGCIGNILGNMDAYSNNAEHLAMLSNAVGFGNSIKIITTEPDDHVYEEIQDTYTTGSERVGRIMGDDDISFEPRNRVNNYEDIQHHQNNPTQHSHKSSNRLKGKKYNLSF